MRSLFVIALVVSGISAQGGELLAGAAKRKITPDLKAGGSVWMAGFDNGRAATGVHDDLWVRCLALSAGGTPVAICGVDSIGLFREDVQKIRQGAKAKLKRDVDVIVAATHVHEAPDTMGLWGPKQGVSGIDEAYNQMVVDRAVEAVYDAVATLHPATAIPAAIKPAGVEAYFNDTRPPVVLDPEILSLGLNDLRGERIATLVNWANHPEALGSKNTLITADYPAALYTKLEELNGGQAVFINGAVGGMQSPLGARVIDPATKSPAPPDSFRMASLIGTFAAESAEQLLDEDSEVEVDRVQYFEKDVTIPVTNQGYLAGSAAGVFKGRKPMAANQTTTTSVGYLRISGGGKAVLEAAIIPGELYPELSVGGVVRDKNADFPNAPVEPAIKQAMTAPVKMLFGLAGDEIGYIIPKAEWDEKPPYTFGAKQRWYGEINSVGPEAAPLITKAFVELVQGAGAP
jgi:hypothetical protein